MALLPTVSEAELQVAILDAAALYGWMSMHVRPVHTREGGADRYITPTTSEGWPDLTLARAGTVLFLELKGAKGKPTTEQLEWLYALGGWLIYPRHLDLVLDALRTGMLLAPAGVRVDQHGNIW